MSSQAMCAEMRVDVREHARQSKFEQQLRRYRPKLQPAIRALASRHMRLAELSESFPALLAALAWPRHGVDVRPIIAAVISGAPLASLAKFAGVPLWLRRLRPELIVAPLPTLPDSPFIQRRIVNHLPKSPKRADVWFDTVSTGALWGHEPFALWCAANFGTQIRSRRHVPSVRMLSVWAWYSLRPETLGFEVMQARWNPEMQIKAALQAVSQWQDALDLLLHIPDSVSSAAWHTPAVVDGFSFTPLSEFAAIRDEAQAMQNCVLSYGDGIKADTSQLWSVRKDGVRVATLEMRREGANPFPVLHQLLGVRNQRASRDVWMAAHGWLAGQESHVFDDDWLNDSGTLHDRRQWAALWKPYWLAKRTVPAWLPLVPKTYTLWNI